MGDVNCGRKVLDGIDVQNDPVNFIDPEGLQNWGKFWTGVGTGTVGLLKAGLGTGILVATAAHVEATGGLSLLTLAPLEHLAAGGYLVGAGGLLFYQGLGMALEGWYEDEPCP